jgi:hypothetical protein
MAQETEKDLEFFLHGLREDTEVTRATISSLYEKAPEQTLSKTGELREMMGVYRVKAGHFSEKLEQILKGEKSSSDQIMGVMHEMTLLRREVLAMIEQYKTLPQPEPDPNKKPQTFRESIQEAMKILEPRRGNILIQKAIKELSERDPPVKQGTQFEEFEKIMDRLEREFPKEAAELEEMIAKQEEEDRIQEEKDLQTYEEVEQELAELGTAEPTLETPEDEEDWEDLELTDEDLDVTGEEPQYSEEFLTWTEEKDQELLDEQDWLEFLAANPGLSMKDHQTYQAFERWLDVQHPETETAEERSSKIHKAMIARAERQLGDEQKEERLKAKTSKPPMDTSDPEKTPM